MWCCLHTSILQGKIKGSYTCDKMAEFVRRGTLSASQLVLGIDRNLSYIARQVGAQQQLVAVATRYRQQSSVVISSTRGAAWALCAYDQLPWRWVGYAADSGCCLQALPT